MIIITRNHLSCFWKIILRHISKSFVTKIQVERNNLSKTKCIPKHSSKIIKMSVTSTLTDSKNVVLTLLERKLLHVIGVEIIVVWLGTTASSIFVKQWSRVYWPLTPSSSVFTNSYLYSSKCFGLQVHVALPKKIEDQKDWSTWNLFLSILCCVHAILVHTQYITVDSIIVCTVYTLI